MDYAKLLIGRARRVPPMLAQNNKSEAGKRG
jgi:hypothetical protein